MACIITTHWNKWLHFFPAEKKDVYFTEEYIKLYEDECQKAFCFVYKENDKILIFPYLLRTFEFKGKKYHDFETAYGYGGPIANIEDKTFTDTALCFFIEYCKEFNYVAGFIRFCPLLKNYELCNGLIPLIMDRHTVAINLDMPIEDIWMKELHTKNRNVIKKGEKEGLTFEADYEFKYLSDFIDLYNATMDKLEATNFYYFDNKYYYRLINTMHNRFLGVVKHDNQIISAAIFFYSEVYGHYHLSGSDKNALRLTPNNFMIWSAAKELHSKGIKYFHLGGGTTSSDEDSLLGFKRKYSKSLYYFCLGKIIFNGDVYAEICEEWEFNNPDKKNIYKNFLLKYKY